MATPTEPTRITFLDFNGEEWEAVRMLNIHDGKVTTIDMGAGASQPKRIVCSPTPCRGGWHYAPDFYGLTSFG
jgi:hypothetical protein